MTAFQKCQKLALSLFIKAERHIFWNFRLDQTNHVIVSSFKSLLWLFLFTGRSYYAAPTNKLSRTPSDQCTAIVGCYDYWTVVSTLVQFKHEVTHKKSL